MKNFANYVVSIYVLCLTLVHGDPNFSMKRYDDYSIIRVNASFADQLSEYDVLGQSVAGTLDVLVSSEQLATIAKQKTVAYTTADTNVQQIIDEEQADITRMVKPAAANQGWFTSYHRYDAIKAWFKDLADSHPNVLQYIKSIGKTHENRDIFAIKITANAGTEHSKKQIFLQGLIHAREWISGAVVQYITNELVQGYGSDDGITKLLQKVEFVIVPCLNADGYEYTWTNDRMWRKNRRNNGKNKPWGVDLNRNYNDHWDQEFGASPWPVSEVYKGPFAVSEPEIQAVTKFFLANKNIIGAIDFHSYGQLILRPLGYKRQKSPHEEKHKKLGYEMQQIIKSVHGFHYYNIPAYVMYPASGTADDWFYGKEVSEAFGHHVYTYTMEVRPNNWSEKIFVLPPTQIIATGQEIFPAIVHFATAALADPLP